MVAIVHISMLIFYKPVAIMDVDIQCHIFCKPVATMYANVYIFYKPLAIMHGLTYCTYKCIYPICKNA